MSGECGVCGEHAIDCICKQEKIHPWGHFLNARYYAIVWMKEEMKYDDKKIAQHLSMDEEQVYLIRKGKFVFMKDINDLIKILKRARNCDQALNTLKMLQENGQWEKQNRERYPVQDLNLWYEYIKENIDKCITLIEEDDDV